MTAANASLVMEHSPMAFLRRTALASFLAAVFAAPVAFGQPPPGFPVSPPPIPAPQPPPQTQCSGGVCLPPSAINTPPPTNYVPYSYNPWGVPAYQGAVGGALSGAANLVNAQGQYQIQNQQSRVIQTQADMSRIDYRNALIQQQKYEQSLQPTTLELQQQEQWRKLQTARNNPSNTEIWSGDSLNALLTALQGAQVQGLKADPVPLTTEVMQRINFTTGTQSGAGVGMLKQFNSLQWPFALQDPPFLDSITKISDLANKAVDEVKSSGRVTAMTFKDLDNSVAALSGAIASNKTLSPSDWIESKGFVDDLRSSVQTLRNPQVAQYFQGQFRPQAGTVDELVRQMSMNGLRFAPATQGDQAAYTALQQQMRTYDYRLAQLAAR
jgi:hypothetical protein